MNYGTLIPHLFRTEYGKITAVLCKHFGLAHLEDAEDLASEAFVSALNTWPYHGVPDNPTAWLYRVAKNKTLNYLERSKTFNVRVSSELDSEKVSEPIDLSDVNITDSQLQMLFAICHPDIPAESQIGLALRTLCGFGIDEIATAFLTNKETVNKRLFRARERLRQEKIAIQLPPEPELLPRLESVLRTLYLLFSEGYYSESNPEILREDLCGEAMRLTYLLMHHPATHLPEVNALMALMCFHASRFPARKNEQGNPVWYDEQNTALWDQQLITKGVAYLKNAATGKRLTKYHLEASIAYWYTQKQGTPDKWPSILNLYNQLLVIEYSPIAALSRAYAVAQVRGAEEGISEAEKLKLTNNPFYFVLLGELYRNIDRSKSVGHFNRALSLAKTAHDQEQIRRKLNMLQDVNK